MRSRLAALVLTTIIGSAEARYISDRIELPPVLAPVLKRDPGLEHIRKDPRLSKKLHSQRFPIGEAVRDYARTRNIAPQPVYVVTLAAPSESADLATAFLVFHGGKVAYGCDTNGDCRSFYLAHVESSLGMQRVGYDVRAVPLAEARTVLEATQKEPLRALFYHREQDQLHMVLEGDQRRVVAFPSAQHVTAGRYN